MAEGSPPDDPWKRSRNERIGNAIRQAQERGLSKLGSDLELKRTLEEGNRRRKASLRAVRNELIPIFLSQMSKADNPGFDRKAKAWPIAVSYRTGGKAAIPQWIVALDKRGRLWHAGTLRPREPYTDISAGRLGRVEQADAEGLHFHPIGHSHYNPDIHQLYLSEAFEESIGWYIAKFPALTWPGWEPPVGT